MEVHAGGALDAAGARLGPYEILAPLGAGGMGEVLDAFLYPPGLLDLATGKITRIETGQPADHLAFAWMPDGRILAAAYGVRSEMWKFTPEGR